MLVFTRRGRKPPEPVAEQSVWGRLAGVAIEAAADAASSHSRRGTPPAPGCGGCQSEAARMREARLARERRRPR